MTGSSVDTVRFVVRSIATTAVENEDYFGELDAVVGDGDFGFSLARGFEKVLEDIDDYPDDTASALLQAAAMTISSRVGGTSGPIWGTGFLRASLSLRDTDEIDLAAVVALLRAAAEGIQARGKAQLGDKTLLDALIPATDALAAADAEGEADSSALVARFAAATRESAEATSSLRAMRGRASYSGERSIGSPDAGAVALAVIAERLAEQWPQRPGAENPDAG
ncbi:dihydroxyacetone kinase subunit DhaL [Microbacterium sp. 18062]|uniref:dihydroxyacetone kinase subunit DhaL n=1 Tax=Microbacterium sp. 18062 TaxID=2681410 RepID=UPI001357D487|nr:dihydroxyacetone kinase subunit DhaL [Microbacterium sp. 18062]